MPAKVNLVEHLGSELFLYCDPVMTADSPVKVRGQRVIIREDKRHNFQVDDVLHIKPRVGECTFYDPKSEVNLEYVA